MTKALFALSCNRCAYPGCDERLADPAWSGVRADIAHIHGEKPGAARYLEDLPDVDAFENLVLMCPNHHREIDRLQPEEWPAERLRQVKEAHESACDRHDWAPDQLLEIYAGLALGAPAVTPSTRVSMMLQRGDGEVLELANVGDGTAFEVEVTPFPDSPSFVDALEGPLERLPPFSVVKVGYVGLAVGETAPAFEIGWVDESGEIHAETHPYPSG